MRNLLIRIPTRPSFSKESIEYEDDGLGRLPLLFLLLLVLGLDSVRADPLPSWNDTEPKQAIVGFVEKFTKEGSPDFVPPAERIAVFDNDGTLWAEQPIYFQGLFLFDRVRAVAPQHQSGKRKSLSPRCSRAI